MTKKISVVLGTYNRKNFLQLAIETIRSELVNCGVESEIIVVDGGSTDGTIEWLTKQKDIISIIQHNRGEWRGKKIERRSWGYFMNLGFRCASGKYVCMISDDCLVLPNAIKNGLKLFEKKIKEKKKIGAVAFFFRDWPFSKNYHVNYNFGKVYVNHGLYLNEILKKVEYVDEDSYRFYGADIDLMMKMREVNYNCIESPTSFVEHFADANNLVRNTNNDAAKNDTVSLQDKWGEKYGKLGGRQREIFFRDTYETVNKFKFPLVAEYKDQFLRSPVEFIKRVWRFL